jgi:hypothetical protein
VKQVTTFVGIDAHKKDLFVAILIGTRREPVTWTVLNEPSAVRRWCGSSSEKRQVRCTPATKPGPVAMRCSGR